MNAALAPSFFILGADVRRFTEANIEKTGGGVKKGFNCLRAQTVTEGTLGKNTQVS